MSAPVAGDGRSHDTASRTPSRSPLRVLVLSQFYWPEEFRINSLVDELRRSGVDVDILTGQPNYPAGKVFDGFRSTGIGIQKHPGGYDIFRVPLIPRGKGGGLRLGLNYLSFLVTASLAAPVLLRKRRFDVIFVYATSPVLQGFAALPLRWFKRAPVVLWVQDLWPHALSATGHVRNSHVLAMVERLVALLYRRVDLILAQSEAFLDAIRPLAGSTPVSYFPNPGDPASPAKSKTRLKLAQGFNVVFAGNLGQAQALESVVEAATLLRDEPEVRITLFGSGSMQPWIERQIKERKLTNLVLAGRVPAKSMPGIYEQASALLLTLASDEFLAKTIPSKLQSYLSAGVPVIAATKGEAERVVRESGAGITCLPEDPRALAAAIRQVRAMPPARLQAIRRSARAYYDAHFEPGLLAARLVEQLRAVARPREPFEVSSQ